MLNTQRLYTDREFARATAALWNLPDADLVSLINRGAVNYDHRNDGQCEGSHLFPHPFIINNRPASKPITWSRLYIRHMTNTGAERLSLLSNLIRLSEEYFTSSSKSSSPQQNPESFQDSH